MARVYPDLARLCRRIHTPETVCQLKIVIPLLVLMIGLTALAITTRAERLPIRTYTTADGLWSSAINYLMRDSHGFIWLCTRDGLSRFDGYRFTNYKIRNAASPAIDYLLETRAGVYWLAVQGSGVYRFNAATTVSDEGSRQNKKPIEAGRLTLNAEFVSPVGFSVLFEQSNGKLW